MGLLAWFSAEIVTFSTALEKIDGGVIVFSFSYYLVQVALILDLILRKRFSLWQIFLVGLIYGILEEAFYIKNPLSLMLLLAIGHSAVTITFPYLLVNYLIPGEKKPFLSPRGYAFSLIYLGLLYFLMAQFLPFVYPDSILLGSALIVFFGFLIHKSSSERVSPGIRQREKIGIILLAILLIILSQQNYLGVILLFSWLIIRRRLASQGDIYFATVSFLTFHFLASFINASADPGKIIINYPVIFLVGLSLLFLLVKKHSQILTPGVKQIQTSGE
jgi:hypothetical protein